MPHYANRGGDSGIASYETTADSITVTFQDNSIYLYNYSRPGQLHVEQMKSLATAGEGLNEYINRFVRKNYAAKLR